MPVGDIGRWQDNAGGAYTYPSAFTAFSQWLQELRNDGIFTLTGNQTLTSSEVGNYLVLYSQLWDSTANNRTSTHSRILQASASLAGSWGSDYCRNTANSEILTRGAGLVLNASLNLDVEFRREGQSAGNLLTGSTVLTAVRLPDDGDAEYLHLQTPAANALNGQTWSDVEGWDAVRTTNASVLELDANGRDILLRDPNRLYLVLYSLPLNQGSGSRSQRITRCTVGGAVQAGSFGYTYLRNTNPGWGCVRRMFMVPPPGVADQPLVIQGQRGAADVDGTVSIFNAAGEAGVFVVALPTNAVGFVGEDGTGAQTVSGAVTVDLNVARTAAHADTAAFQRTSDTQVEVVQAADVLFSAGARTSRSNLTSGTRGSFRGRVTVDGTPQGIGAGRVYTRGNQGSTDTFDGVVLAEEVFDASAGALLGFESSDYGDNGAGDDTQAGEVGCFALSLDFSTGGGSFGELASDSAVGVAAQADLSASGELESSAAADVAAAGTLTAWGELSAVASADVASAAAASANASVSASSSFSIAASAELAVMASLAAASVIDVSAAALIHAWGELATGSSYVGSGYVGSGYVLAGEGVDFEASASVDAASSSELSSEATVSLSASADLTAFGELVSSASASVASSAGLSGPLSGEASSQVDFSATADISASGDLQAVSQVDFSAAAASTAPGDLAAPAAVDFGASALLSGDSAIGASAAVDFSSLAALSAAASIEAAAALDVEASASVNAFGELSCSSTVSLSADADLSAQADGELVARSTVGLSASSQASASASLASSSALTVAASAGLGAWAGAAAAADVSYAASASGSLLAELRCDSGQDVSASGALSAWASIDVLVTSAFGPSSVPISAYGSVASFEFVDVGALAGVVGQSNAIRFYVQIPSSVRTECDVPSATRYTVRVPSAIRTEVQIP